MPKIGEVFSPGLLQTALQQKDRATERAIRRDELNAQLKAQNKEQNLRAALMARGQDADTEQARARTGLQRQAVESDSKRAANEALAKQRLAKALETKSLLDARENDLVSRADLRETRKNDLLATQEGRIAKSVAQLELYGVRKDKILAELDAMPEKNRMAAEAHINQMADVASRIRSREARAELAVLTREMIGAVSSSRSKQSIGNLRLKIAKMENRTDDFGREIANNAELKQALDQMKAQLDDAMIQEYPEEYERIRGIIRGDNMSQMFEIMAEDGELDATEDELDEAAAFRKSQGNKNVGEDIDAGDNPFLGPLKDLLGK
jgi:hypothetical protein